MNKPILLISKINNISSHYIFQDLNSLLKLALRLQLKYCAKINLDT